MYKDPTNFRKRFLAYKNGKMPYKNGRPTEDEEFESFRQTLPDNQKEPGDYRTRRYWELNDKPKTFGEAIGRGMYNLGDSGKYGQYGIEIPAWHANSVAYDKATGNYEFMKPNSHPTRWMEDVYGYWGSDMQDFRENYKLQKGPVYDKYVPKKNVYKLPKFEDGTEPIDGGTPFGVVVTGRDRRPAWKRMYLNPRLGDTSLYYNPDNVVSGLNVLTLGGMNNLSPTQWARRAYDVRRLVDGSMSTSQYADRWINGNEGIVTRKFSKEHPYLSTGINLAVDGVLTMVKPSKATGKVIKMLPDIDFSYKGASGDSKGLMKKIVGMAARDELAGILDDASRKLYGIEKGKTYTKYPSVVVDNLINSILPRMKTMRPWIKEKDFDRMFTQAADGKWTIHPSSTFKKVYGDDTSVIGLYTDNGNVAINANAPNLDDVLLHEIRHKLDAEIPLTSEEEAYLRAAYGDTFIQLPKTDPSWAKTGIGEDYDIWNEAVTTNRDARDVVLGPVHSRMTPVNLLNKIIDNVSDLMILEAVSRSNGYGRRYVDALIGDGPLDASLVSKEQIQAWRNAMKYVGSGALAVGLSRPLLFNTYAE